MSGVVALRPDSAQAARFNVEVTVRMRVPASDGLTRNGTIPPQLWSGSAGGAAYRVMSRYRLTVARQTQNGLERWRRRRRADDRRSVGASPDDAVMARGEPDVERVGPGAADDHGSADVEVRRVESLGRENKGVRHLCSRFGGFPNGPSRIRTGDQEIMSLLL